MDSKTEEQLVEEITAMLKKLPTRPEIEEVTAAKTLIKNLEKEENSKIDTINNQTKENDVAHELFHVYKEMQKCLVDYQSKEKQRDAVKLLDLENAHQVFDEMIQRASKCISPNSDVGSSKIGGESSSYSKREVVSKDDSYIGKSKEITSVGLSKVTSSMKAASVSDDVIIGQDGEKMSLIKFASLIEVSAKTATKEINLRNKLSEDVEWLPDSIGKLLSLTTLDLSENTIVALPVTLGWLSSLSRLDLHNNKISELPESIGELLNLVFLDLRGNSLVRLSPSIGRLIRLEELDVGSTNLSSLPETIGSLVRLRKLNVNVNQLNELPHTIGQCSSLRELLVEHNHLKALPEAVGNIESLEILSLRYNYIRQLPTTMSSLTNLRELNVSFNNLEAVPESLCSVTALVKLDISHNFADLRSLPRSIGSLASLEVLDLGNNQIRTLPDSFSSLSRLSVLSANPNPWEVPPPEITERGAEAVVQYMADRVANRQAQPRRQKISWRFCFNKRKRGGGDYADT
ncbi:hypothetical protein vseg_015612 [Gypsophila vaccaria]